MNVGRHHQPQLLRRRRRSTRREGISVNRKLYKLLYVPTPTQKRQRKRALRKQNHKKAYRGLVGLCFSMVVWL